MLNAEIRKLAKTAMSFLFMSHPLNCLVGLTVAEM